MAELLRHRQTKEAATTRPIVIANVIGAKDKAGLKLKSRLRAALSYLRSSASI